MSPSVIALIIALAPSAPLIARDQELPPVAVPAEAPYGYTYCPARDLKLAIRYPAQRYDPQPGDVILLSDTNLLWRAIYAVARTGAPGHIGIVVRLPDGRLGLHEAGFNESLWTRAAPLDYRLNHYPGKVWVRRIQTPLTPEQDRLLTDFVRITENQPYNLRKAKLQFTPLRQRGLIRTKFIGKPRGPERPMICSQAVLEALVYIGAIDAETTRPSATYPRDLFFDRSINPYIHRHPPLAAGWEAPALWTPIVGLAMKGRDRPAPAEAVILPPPEIPHGNERSPRRFPPPRRREGGRAPFVQSSAPAMERSQ